MPLAVISTGGKQYLVKVGDTVKIEKIDGKAGDSVTFDTMLITSEDGADIQVGSPLLSAKVAASIVKQELGEKVLVGKFKSKVRYKKRIGHRQQHTVIKIEKI